MALRAFRTNPSIGGFGGESQVGSKYSDVKRATTGYGDSNFGGGKTLTDISGDNHKSNQEKEENHEVASESCDAFAQIIKELVDNAVDACNTSKNNIQNRRSEAVENNLKRVRVSIERLDKKIPGTASLSSTKNEKVIPSLNMSDRQALRVTVMDNGCGMRSIENCVSCFSSSKSNSSPNRQKANTDGSGRKQKTKKKGKRKHSDTNSDQNHTTGRYGIGLTLCLLHAQRLVPNSCASITSATATAKHWTRASFVVDTEGDSVVCVKKEILPKHQPKESGTAVSLLVPVSLKTVRIFVLLKKDICIYI